jgi:hypothetical protein
MTVHTANAHCALLFLRCRKLLTVQDGTVWLRILPDFNGAHNSWSAGFLGSGASYADLAVQRDPETFKAAYRAVAGELIGMPHVKLQMAFACENAASINQPWWQAYYPGDQYVDSIAAACYNEPGVNGYVCLSLTLLSVCACLRV